MRTLAGHEMMHELEGGHRGQAQLGSIDAQYRGLSAGLGTPTSSPTSFLPEQPSACTAFLAWADLPPEVSTLMPRCAGKASSRIDLFYAHIGGMDAFARGFEKSPQAIITDSRLADVVKTRYQSWDCELGRPRRGGPSAASLTWKRTSSPRETPPRTRAAGKKCLRI